MDSVLSCIISAYMILSEIANLLLLSLISFFLGFKKKTIRNQFKKSQGKGCSSMSQQHLLGKHEVLSLIPGTPWQNI